MKQLSKADSKNGPGVTVLKIFLCTLLISTIIVAYAPYACERIDLFMEDLRHQLYALLFCVLVFSVFSIKWFVKKVKG